MDKTIIPFLELLLNKIQSQYLLFATFVFLCLILYSSQIIDLFQKLDLFNDKENTERLNKATRYNEELLRSKNELIERLKTQGNMLKSLYRQTDNIRSEVRVLINYVRMIRNVTTLDTVKNYCNDVEESLKKITALIEKMRD